MVCSFHRSQEGGVRNDPNCSMGCGLVEIRTGEARDVRGSGLRAYQALSNRDAEDDE